MQKILWLLLFLAACAGVNPPPDFHYQEIDAGHFKLASWQKITNPTAPYKIYIEGDGYAFTRSGKPSSNPTPNSDFVRKLAFGDPSPNVIYLARPCQYIKSDICAPRHWTSARFAPEIINAEFSTVKQIAGNSEVILIGFSGGAQISGLIATAKPGLRVKKIITIAGNLDHLAWSQYQKLPLLTESMNLESYRHQYLQIPQIHYVGAKDKVIPPFLVQEFVGHRYPVIIVKDAEHNTGWEEIYEQIYFETTF